MGLVSLKVLAAKGITDESLRKKFEGVQYPFSGALVGIASDDITRLAYRVRTRVQDGILNNFRTYKIFHAIDQAWDVPFKQVSPTLMQSLAEHKFDESVLNAATEWGYTHLIQDDIDEKTGKPTGKKKFSVPTFFNVFIPLVRAYVLIRAAKLTGDRALVPYFKYEPVRSTAINRARCEIITDRIQVMSTQMGYPDIGRQAILRMLLYGAQLMFIQEEWWKDEQEQFKGGSEEEFETVLSREGLRYHLPHPSRTYWDQAHPLSSLNTNTGMEFCGYWRVHRFRDVRLNMHLWNTDKIVFNNVDLRRDQAVFFNTVYGSCTLQFPQSCTAAWQSLDREDNLRNRFYTSDFDDSAVVLTEHFELLNPKRDGLGDYDHNVWFRFVTGGDGTILYCSPLPGTPATYWGYDPDEARYLNSSLALEVLPFQDQVSNLLTQALLSVKQNLANLTFVDSDILDEESIKKLENTGEGWFRKLNFFRFSGRKTRAAQQDVRYAFGSVRFPQLDVPALFNAINAVLGILERALVMSAQEIAGQATHEQSKQEIIGVQASSSSRLEYTAGMVDRAWDGWKHQLYTYLMAFGAEETYAQLSQDPVYTPELLSMLGFTVEHKATRHGDKHLVKGNLSALQIEYFSSTRDGEQRTNDTTVATAMLQMLTTALQNPMIAQTIGPEQSIMLVNEVLEQMGLPKDFKLRPMPPQVPPEQQQQMMAEQFKQLSQQVQQFVKQNQQELMKEVGAEIKPLADAVKQAMKLGEKNDKQVAKILELMAQQPKALLPTPTTTTTPGQPTLTIGGPAAP
jgi:hypothetical protein